MVGILLVVSCTRTAFASIVDGTRKAREPQRRFHVTAQADALKGSIAGTRVGTPTMRREPLSGEPAAEHFKQAPFGLDAMALAQTSVSFPAALLQSSCDRTKICQCGLEHTLAGIPLGEYHTCGETGDLVPLSKAKEAEFKLAKAAVDSDAFECDNWKKMVCCSKLYCNASLSLATQGCEQFKKGLDPKCGFDCAGGACPTRASLKGGWADFGVTLAVARVQAHIAFIVLVVILGLAAIVRVTLFPRQVRPRLPQPPVMTSAGDEK